MPIVEKNIQEQVDKICSDPTFDDIHLLENSEEFVTALADCLVVNDKSSGE